jgi:hypothetical protein
VRTVFEGDEAPGDATVAGCVELVVRHEKRSVPECDHRWILFIRDRCGNRQWGDIVRTVDRRSDDVERIVW